MSTNEDSQHRLTAPLQEEVAAAVEAQAMDVHHQEHIAHVNTALLHAVSCGKTSTARASRKRPKKSSRVTKQMPSAQRPLRTLMAALFKSLMPHPRPARPAVTSVPAQSSTSSYPYQQHPAPLSYPAQQVSQSTFVLGRDDNGYAGPFRIPIQAEASYARTHAGNSQNSQSPSPRFEQQMAYEQDTHYRI